MPAREGGGFSERIVPKRSGKHGRQPGRFILGEVGGWFAEMMTSGRFCAIDPSSPFCHIQVQFKNPPFREMAFERSGDQGLVGLPEE